MIRGTTPTYTITADADLTGWDCYLTLKTALREIDLENDRLALEVHPAQNGAPAYTLVTFTLTQLETLSLRAGDKCEVQLRIKKGDVADASDTGELTVKKILRNGEI